MLLLSSLKHKTAALGLQTLVFTPFHTHFAFFLNGVFLVNFNFALYFKNVFSFYTLITWSPPFHCPLEPPPCSALPSRQEAGGRASLHLLGPPRLHPALFPRIPALLTNARHRFDIISCGTRCYLSFLDRATWKTSPCV